jgi:tRNA A-37 threonylcarbamoyl transferase component Bud32
MSQKLKIPASFAIVKIGNTTLFVKEKHKECILRIVLDKEFLHESGNNAQVKFGRGSYLSVPVAENSPERFVVRDYRHGGLLGKLFGGIFLNGDRPLNEMFTSEIASQRGVPSAEVIAIAKRRLWGIFYKAKFISKEIDGAVDMVEFLKKSSVEFIQTYKKPVIFALVKLIRNMHDAGIYHADLHLKNILLKKDSTGEFTAYIIDLDKSVVLDKLDIQQRIRNLLRLDRSLEKLRWLSGKTHSYQKNMKDDGSIHASSLPRREWAKGKVKQGFPDMDHQVNVPASHVNESGEFLGKKLALISKTDRLRFFKAYMLFDRAIDKNWKMYIRRYYSHHSLHKFWWRVSGLPRSNTEKGELRGRNYSEFHSVKSLI